MQPLKALIVDDERPARDELKYLLKRNAEIKIVGEAEDGQSAIKLAEELQPDVIFMDIEMRSVNGYDAASHILSKEAPPLIVFATAYDSYAIGAFEMGAIDYILKPFEETRIDNTITRIKKLKEQSSEWSQAVEKLRQIVSGEKNTVKKIGLEKNGRITMVNFSDIIFAEAHDKSVTVTCCRDKLIFNGTLSELETRLKGLPFMRVHRSFLVNLDQVTGVIPWFKGTYWLILNNSEDMKIPVSKSVVKILKDILNIA